MLRDQKGRHGANPFGAGVRVAGTDVIGVGIIGQKPRRHRPVHASRRRDIGQNTRIADIAPLAPIGAHDGRDHGRLPPLKPRPMDQPVCVQRVGHPPGGVRVNFGPGSAACLFQPQMHLDQAVLSELRGQIVVLVDALGGHIGVQLERVPFNAKRVVGMGLKRAIEIGLADIAPGANRIGEDIKPDHHGRPAGRRAGRGG